jgi:hypothetical protein
MLFTHFRLKCFTIPSSSQAKVGAEHTKTLISDYICLFRRFPFNLFAEQASFALFIHPCNAYMTGAVFRDGYGDKRTME